jgi:hypothetical protein
VQGVLVPQVGGRSASGVSGATVHSRGEMNMDRMTLELLEFVRQCIADDNVHAFYTCWVWLKRREEILELDKRECQYCKARGKYKRATTVHHAKHLKEYPELALNLYYIDDDGRQQRQLISTCFDCHEEQHPERRKNFGDIERLTPERW